MKKCVFWIVINVRIEGSKTTPKALTGESAQETFLNSSNPECSNKKLSGSFWHHLLGFLKELLYVYLLYINSIFLYCLREFLINSSWLKDWTTLFYYPRIIADESVTPCFSEFNTLGRSTWLRPSILGTVLYCRKWLVFSKKYSLELALWLWGNTWNYLLNSCFYYLVFLPYWSSLEQAPIIFFNLRFNSIYRITSAC